MRSRTRGFQAIFCASAAGLLTSVAQADPISLPKGMSVPIMLQQHVTSGYVPAGAPVYFVVESDVSLGGQVVIRKGTPVIGKMDAAQSRGMVGKSGSMALSVRSVEAIDGTVVPIDADLSKQGRSRSGATVAWVLFWGLPGLMTRGVNPYVERGTIWDANVLGDIQVDVGKARPVATEANPAQQIAVTGHEFAVEGLNKALEFNIEKDKKLKTLKLMVDPAAVPGAAEALASLQLVAVGDERLVEPVVAVAADTGSVTFDTWSVVRFCSDGPTRLTFRGVTKDGTPFGASHSIIVKIKKKG